MGATNQIKGTNISLQLEGKQCPQCSQKFTQSEIDDRNFDIWWDTSNDVELKKLDYKDWYSFSIIIRSIEHEYCPIVKECEKCYTKFLEDNMIETKDSDFYCQPCYKEITNKEI